MQLPAVRCREGTKELDLLMKLLVFDPQNRLTADGALQHSYFRDHKPVAGALHAFEDMGFGLALGRPLAPTWFCSGSGKQPSGAAIMHQRASL